MTNLADVSQFICDYLLRADGHLKPKPTLSWWEDKSAIHILNYINEVTSFIDNPQWSQQIWHIRNSVLSPVHCPSCEKVLTWKISISRYPTSCSNKCASTSPTKLAKFTDTCIKRYGVSAPAKSAGVLEKRKSTLIEKYGVDSYSKTQEFSDKVTKTNIEKYGVANIMQLPETSQRIAETNQRKYGAKHARCLHEYKEKQRNTNIERFGGPSPMSSSVVKNKVADTCTATYGVDNYNRLQVSAESLSILNNAAELSQRLITQSASTIASELLVDTTTVINYIKKHGIHNQLQKNQRTLIEINFAKFLTAHNIEFVTNVRDVIAPKELDFYIPSLKLAVEVGSVYWHSEIRSNRGKLYHYNKWKSCKDAGITLLTYFDDDMIRAQTVIESKILYMAGKLGSNRIGARLTTIAPISIADEREFLNKNHIQGFLNSRTHSYGAYYSGKLVGVMCVTVRERYAEITRYSTDVSFILSGLFSKMLSHFIKDTKYSGKIVSFSDNCHSNGALYLRAGFTMARELGPGYSYTYGGKPRENRQGYMKSKIAKKFNVDISGKTEWELMQSLGYDRVWDCGKLLWEIDV